MRQVYDFEAVMWIIGVQLLIKAVSFDPLALKMLISVENLLIKTDLRTSTI
jgi:hypothetical protein